jgi:TyrR family helix-turn-helix protein
MCQNSLGEFNEACSGYIFYIARVGRGLMIEIGLNRIEKYYGANHILKDVSFEMKSGERVGLLGKNGAGKTVLFKIIAGVEKHDSGERITRRGAVVGMLDQIPDFPIGFKAYDVLHSAYDEVMKIRQQMVQLEQQMTQHCNLDSILEKFGRLQQLYETCNGYAIEENINKMIHGLHLDDEMLNTDFSRLSGGEKTKVVLGRLLLMQPDIVLLDEPTNHLDVKAIEWLENFLDEYQGTVMVISHDRYFLDRVVSRIVEIVDGKSQIYEGNYSYFVVEKEARYLRQMEKYEQEKRKIKQLEAAASRLHDWASRADNPAMHRQAFNIEKRMERIFAPVNCAALPDALLESELFGYEEGAFTGAQKYGKSGLFEYANGGTIFLDEIGELSISLQAKLLRVLQEGKIRRVGGNQEIDVDVRIITATHSDLEEMLRKNQFREDLYYRLNVIPIFIPPLRERKEDLPLLIESLLFKKNHRLKKHVKHILKPAMDKLMQHDWLGNVRELENVMERAVSFASQGEITQDDIILDHVTSATSVVASPASKSRKLKEVLEEMECCILHETINKYGTSRQVGKILGLSHTGVLNRMKKYNIPSKN